MSAGQLERNFILFISLSGRTRGLAPGCFTVLVSGPCGFRMESECE